MTTNAFDMAAAMLATDSRWSQRSGRWLVYVDDTDFHKIEPSAQATFMFAGRGRKIQEWKSWIRAGAIEADTPELKDICLLAVDATTHKTRICEGMVVNTDAIFGGSGAIYALSCWSANKDIHRSIDTAKTIDPATGGETRFFCMKTRQNNVGIAAAAEASIDAVDRAILSRGIVMDTASNTRASAPPFRLSELAANNDEVKELQDKIASGELSAEAPSEAMYNEWTDEQKTRVKSALADIFGWRK